MIHHEPRAEHIVTPNKPSLPSFVMSLPDAVACYDASGVCQEVFIPAGFISMLPATNMIGMAIEDDPTLPADTITKLRRCLQQTLETAQPQACRYDVYKEGRLYARDVRFSLLDGELAGHVLAVFRDITEMRQTELALEAQNRHLRTLVGTLPDGVIQLNADGVYLDVHMPKGFRPALPHDKMSFVGKTLEQVSPPEVAALLRHQLQETLRTGELQRFEYGIHTPQGEVFRRSQFVKLGEHTVLGVISDITRERHTERQLARRERQLQSILNALPYDIARYDKQGMCLEHKPGRQFHNFSPQASTGHVSKHVSEIAHPSVRSTALLHFEQLLASGETQVFEYQLEQDENTHYREILFTMLGDDEVLTIIRDISEQVRDRQALITSEARTQAILSAIPDMIGRCDRDGTILEIIHEGSFKRSRPGAAIVGKPLDTLVSPERAKYVRQQLTRAFETGSTQIVEHHFVIDGEDRYREIRYVPLDDGTFLTLFRDNTQQKLSEQALIANQQRTQAILSAMPDMIARCDRNGTMLEVIHEGTFKRSRSAASIVGKPLDEVTSAERADNVRQQLARALDTHSVQVAERHYTIDGLDYHREVRYVPLEDDTCLVLFRDITEQKRSQLALAASEQQMRAIFSVLPDIIAYFDRNGVHQGNIHTGRLPVGVPLTTVYNQPFSTWLAAEDAQRLQGCLEQTFASGQEQASHYSINITGVTYHRDIRFVYFNQDTCLGLIRDITEAYNAKRALHAALEHSQALLKEVHHRVRNNLQMLSSLLQLHANTLEDDNSKIALADNRRRIQTLALVHRVLYDNETYAEIALDDFLQAALKLFAADMQRLGVTLELHADPVTTNLDDAIPFGLIVNELIKNALEHAFVDGSTKKPRLQVSLQRHHQQVTLTVIDNGSGLSNIAAQAHAKLGMMIVDLLTEQLRGTVNIASLVEADVVQGTQAVLEFQLS
jgi:two-component sensor histidine kinase/transcriptional regulator with PAS, ATPase and Fis domain